MPHGYSTDLVQYVDTRWPAFVLTFEEALVPLEELIMAKAWEALHQRQRIVRAMKRNRDELGFLEKSLSKDVSFVHEPRLDDMSGAAKELIEKERLVAEMVEAHGRIMRTVLK